MLQIIRVVFTVRDYCILYRTNVHYRTIRYYTIPYHYNQDRGSNVLNSVVYLKVFFIVICALIPQIRVRYLLAFYKQYFEYNVRYSFVL